MQQIYLSQIKSFKAPVHIRSFSGPYFATFGLNTERYGESQIYHKNKKMKM